MSDDENPAAEDSPAVDDGPSAAEAYAVLELDADASFQELGLARQRLLRLAQQVYDPGRGKRVHDAYDAIVKDRGGPPSDRDPISEAGRQAFEGLARQAEEALAILGDESREERRTALASQAARAAAGSRLKAYLARERERSEG